MTTLPARKQEDWRNADLDALKHVWKQAGELEREGYAEGAA